MLCFGEEPDTLPDRWRFGCVSAAGADKGSNVYAFRRGPKADPVVVFEANGKFIPSRGKGLFNIPHGLRIDRNGHVWITDTEYHMVMELTTEGKLLRSWGTKGKQGATKDTFNRPTDIAFLPNSDFFVTDSYGNSRVVKLSGDEKYLLE